MDDDEAAMDLDLLLTGPKNKQNLDECLGVGVPVQGVFDCYCPQLEDQFNSLNVNNGEAAVNELEIDDYIDPSMLGCFIPSGSSGHGRRGPRRSSSSERAEISHLFGLLKPSACRGTTFGGKKKIKRWTSREAEKLVEGISIFGVGNWTEVKRAYFKTSFRKPVHLKDKWRDFVRACGINVGSKKKVQAQRATRKIIKGLENKIRFIYRKHAAQNKRAP